MVLTEHGIKFISKSDDSAGNEWVTIEVTKAAIDYMREGMIIKANSIERESVQDPNASDRLKFARGLVDDVNEIRGQFTKH